VPGQEPGASQRPLLKPLIIITWSLPRNSDSSGVDLQTSFHDDQLPPEINDMEKARVGWESI